MFVTTGIIFHDDNMDSSETGPTGRVSYSQVVIQVFTQKMTHSQITTKFT